jgi:hypothetical protein
LFAACAALAIATLTLAQPAAPAAEAVRVIHAGTLLAEPGRAPMRNATVVVRGRKIAKSGPDSWTFQARR